MLGLETGRQPYGSHPTMCFHHRVRVRGREPRRSGPVNSPHSFAKTILPFISYRLDTKQYEGLDPAWALRLIWPAPGTVIEAEQKGD
jgi:hypothetical protein